MDYNKALRIDRYNLEKELVNQPQLYMEWALKAIDASTECASAKNRLEIIKAEVAKKIRANPKKYGLQEKATVDAIRQNIETDKKVKRYTKQYFESYKMERILNEAKNAFQHRKKMLESLVQLNIQLHFAEPRVDGMQRGELSNRQTQDDIRSSLKKRKRKLKRRER